FRFACEFVNKIDRVSHECTPKARNVRPVVGTHRRPHVSQTTSSLTFSVAGRSSSTCRANVTATGSILRITVPVRVWQERQRLYFLRYVWTWNFSEWISISVIRVAILSNLKSEDATTLRPLRPTLPVSPRHNPVV